MTVIANAGLVLKDSQGNKGIVKSFTNNDITKISNAITDVGQVVDPATHMPIEATTASVGVVQLATAQDITNGTAGKVVDAKELINFAQTLPAANGVTDVSSGDNSNQLVVSRIGGSKTLTINNVKHASNADEATHASQADTAAAANSVAWDKVSGKPSSFTPSSHTHTKSQITDFPTIPSKVSQLTNDKGFITSSGSCNYANYSGYVQGDKSTGLYVESVKYGKALVTTNQSGFGAIFNAPTKNYRIGCATYPDSNDEVYLCYSITNANVSSSTNTVNKAMTWNAGTGILSATGFSGSLTGNVTGNCSGSAGSVAWGNVSGKPSTYTPSSHTHDDRYYTESEINTKLSALLLQIYPVGAIYISANSTNPGTLFGGTWKALDQGRVLIGANSTYKAGATGGEFTHTITTSEMPSHTHTGTTGNESAGHTHSGTTGNQSAGHTHSWSGTTSSNGSHAHTASSNSTGAHTHSVDGSVHTYAGEDQNNASHNCGKHCYDYHDLVYGTATSAGAHSHTITVNSNGAHTHTVSGTTGGISANHTHSFTTGGISAHHNHGFTTGASGSGSAMNNMQPYLAVYMWQRTA